jgi:hypothetical protein
MPSLLIFTVARITGFLRGIDCLRKRATELQWHVVDGRWVGINLWEVFLVARERLPTSCPPRWRLPASIFSLNHQSTVTAPLIPRRDVEADGFRRDIHANVMFAPWLDRMPSRHIRAGEIVRLRFLMSRPIRGN